MCDGPVQHFKCEETMEAIAIIVLMGVFWWAHHTYRAVGYASERRAQQEERMKFEFKRGATNKEIADQVGLPVDEVRKFLSWFTGHFDLPFASPAQEAEYQQWRADREKQPTTTMANSRLPG
jgi:hypothetical protein